MSELSIPAPHNAPFAQVYPNPNEIQASQNAAAAANETQAREASGDDVEAQKFGGAENAHHNGSTGSTAGGGVASGTSQYYSTPPSTRGLNNPTVKKVWNGTYAALHKTYLVCDKIGERIANMLGITDSRFQYAVDEYNRMQEQKAEDARRESATATRRAQTVEQGECDGQPDQAQAEMFSNHAHGQSQGGPKQEARSYSQEFNGV